MKLTAKVLTVIIIAVIMLPMLSGCNNGRQVINVFNWGEYIDSDVLSMFTEETGIKINYTTFATNEELYAKLTSGGSDYDVIIPSDYMINRLIQEDKLEKINFDNIPNYSYIMEEYQNLEFDPTNEYSIPYTWGTVVLIYNTVHVSKPVESWDILWDEDYSGKIIMFGNSRDAFGISLQRLGYSVNTTDERELEHAADELRKQRGLVQGYFMDEIFNKMGGEEAWIAPYYAGDALTMIDDNPNLSAAHPKEGTNMFVDSVCIPKCTRNKDGAEQFINFLCRPDIAALNSEYIGYSTPNEGAFDLLDEELINNPVTYPDQEVLEITESFIHLPEETNLLIDRLWIDIRGGSSDDNVWLFPIILAVIVVIFIILIISKKKKKKIN